MSFITSPGIIVPPLTAGGVAYGTGGQAKVNNAGSSGNVLLSAGAGVPTWGSGSGSLVTSFSGASTGLTPATATTGAISLAGTLAVGSGGTSLATLTANNVIVGNGASAPTFVAPGTTGNLLTSNGTTWTSAAASGGVTSFSGASTGLTPSTATTGAVSLAGTLAVASGGTSLNTLTANNVILGNGTSAPTFVAPSTSGNVLTSNGTTWQSTTLAASALTFISSVVASSATEVDIENAYTAYDQYIIIGSEIAITAGGIFSLNFKIGGSYITSATYSYWGIQGSTTGAALTQVIQSAADTQIYNYTQGTANACNIYLRVGVKSGQKTMVSHQVGTDKNGTTFSNGAGTNTSTGALQGIRITGGTYTGTFRLYGVANS